MNMSLIFAFKTLSIDWAESWEEIRLFIDENLKQSLWERLCLSETDDMMVTSPTFVSHL